MSALSFPHLTHLIVKTTWSGFSSSLAVVLKELNSLMPKPRQARAEKVQLPLVSISPAMKVFHRLALVPSSNIPEATQADQKCIRQQCKTFNACVLAFSIAVSLLSALCENWTGRLY